MIIVLYFVISLVPAIPLLKYNYDIAYNTRGDFGFELLNQANIAVLWAAGALLLPLSVLQWVYVLRRGNNVSYFVQISGGLGLLLGSGLLITRDSQYKGFYFLSIVLTVSSPARTAEIDQTATGWFGGALAALLPQFSLP